MGAGHCGNVGRAQVLVCRHCGIRQKGFLSWGGVSKARKKGHGLEMAGVWAGEFSPETGLLWGGGCWQSLSVGQRSGTHRAERCLPWLTSGDSSLVKQRMGIWWSVFGLD